MRKVPIVRLELRNTGLKRLQNLRDWKLRADYFEVEVKGRSPVTVKF